MVMKVQVVFTAEPGDSEDLRGLENCNIIATKVQRAMISVSETNVNDPSDQRQVVALMIHGNIHLA
jgi:hypothetical protein